MILRSIVKMAQELGMEVVAEGAESESEAIELYQLGCEYAQGPVFGDPMSMLQARQSWARRPKRRSSECARARTPSTSLSSKHGLTQRTIAYVSRPHRKSRV